MAQPKVAHGVSCHRNEMQSLAGAEDADLFLRRVDNWMRNGRDLRLISRTFFDKADTNGLGHIPAESVESRIMENLQGLDGWTASMTATMVNELSSRLLTSPSSDKVWDDDWEVAFRKLVQRFKNCSDHYCSSEPSWTLRLKEIEQMQTRQQDDMPLRAHGSVGHPCSSEKLPALMKKRRSARPSLDVTSSSLLPRKSNQGSSAARRRRSLPETLPSSQLPTPKPASQFRHRVNTARTEVLSSIREPAAPMVRFKTRTDSLEEFPHISETYSTARSSRWGRSSCDSSRSSTASSHQPGPSSNYARRLAAVRAMDANTKLWQSEHPGPKGYSAAASGKGGLPKIRKPVRTSQTFGGTINEPNDHELMARQTAQASLSAGRDVDIDWGSLAQIGRVKSEELPGCNHRFSNTQESSSKPSYSKTEWQSAFIKLKAIRGFADIFGVDGLRDAAHECDKNRMMRQNRVEAPKSIFLKLAEKDINGTRKHKLLRRRSAKAIRQVFQGMSLKNDNGYITVHDFIDHVKASAPKLVNQATKMFDKLHNVTEQDRNIQDGDERAVDFSKLLRCLWPGLSDDQVKDITSMAMPRPSTKSSMSKKLDNVQKIYDALNLTKSGFLSREEALKGMDDGRLVTEIAELNYLFGPPNTSYAKSHVTFEDFFAWWCSDLHKAIKEGIDAVQQ